MVDEMTKLLDTRVQANYPNLAAGTPNRRRPVPLGAARGSADPLLPPACAGR
jgi:hypothetical protein